MAGPSCFNDPTIPVAADTSVVINLDLTGYAEAILDALPSRFVVVGQVAAEVEDGRRPGRDDVDVFDRLVASGRIDVVELDASAMGRFVTLVSGPAGETLDDGEAATIAHAVEHGAAALIDERKARRICAERFPALTVGCTVGILAHDDVGAVLGRGALAEAVFNALDRGRMRVLQHHLDWVVDLIGRERAQRCPSLPRSVRSP